MPWSDTPISTLTLPATAGPGQARIVIGPDLPPPLDTYTFTDPNEGGTYSYAGGVIFYPDGDDTSFTYLCAVGEIAGPDTMIWHVGEVDQGAVVESSAGVPKILGLSRNLNTNESNRYLYGDHGVIVLDDDLAIRVGSGANLVTITAGQVPGQLDLANGDGAQVQLSAGGAVGLFAGSGQDIVISAPGSDVDIAGNIDWSGATTVSSGSSNVLVTTTSTAYVLTGTVVGVAFVAPASGKVLIHWRSSMDNNTAGQFCFCAPEVRAGNVVGAGAVHQAANDLVALLLSDTSSDGFGATTEVTGLTPGNTYNVSLWQRSSAAANTASFIRREVIAQPAL